VISHRTVNFIISYIAKPSLVGLAVAALLLFVFPEFRQQNAPDNASSMDLDHRAQGNEWSGPVSYSHAVARAAPSVVNIYTRKITKPTNHPLLNDPYFRRLFNNQQQRIQSSLGSGVIMQADGFMLTNNHVIDGADQILVLLYDGREAAAVVVGKDPETDLAVLKIEADDLQPISVGEPSQARIGDVVLAIGNPYGVGQTVTQGIVSATGRNGLGLNTFENFIQTDADINPGNSGGALVDSYGNLLGINTAILNQSGSVGIGFAIPADTAAKVLQDIVSYGYVVRGWLGMDAFPLTAVIAKRLNLPLSHGLLVRAIYNGSPANLVGIQPGDVVVTINGEPVTDRQSSISQIADVAPGAPIELEIWRQGQTFTVTAVAGIRPTSSR
jgi:serine protease DegS